MLLAQGRMDRLIASCIGENKDHARQFLGGELEVDLTPQGTLVKGLRAGGAGIATFFTRTGVGTLVAEGGLPWRYGGPSASARRGCLVAAGGLMAWSHEQMAAGAALELPDGEYANLGIGLPTSAGADLRLRVWAIQDLNL